MNRLLPISLLVAAALVVAARDELPPQELGGLLLDHTFSPAGSAFAREFAEQWNELNGSNNFNVTITERPEQRGGTRAWIEMDGTPLVVVPLMPGRAAPAQAAVEAAFKRALDRAFNPQAGAVDDQHPLEVTTHEAL